MKLPAPFRKRVAKPPNVMSHKNKCAIDVYSAYRERRVGGKRPPQRRCIGLSIGGSFLGCDLLGKLDLPLVPLPLVLCFQGMYVIENSPLR